MTEQYGKPETTGQAADGPHGRGTGRKKGYALLVDGFVKDLFTTGMILRRLEYDVYIANSAEDALAVVAAAEPALLITELTLPKMSGLELLVRMKHDQKTKTVPVIIHTSEGDANRQELCRASGCAAFLKKPVEPGVLYGAIQQATEATPRRYIRLKTLLPVRVEGLSASGSGFAAEYVSELSENGVFIRTLSPRPLNAVLGVTIMIRSIPVKVRAEVLRSVPLSPGLFQEPGMAMQFVEISATDRELLRNVIKGQILKDIPADQTRPA